ncbi:MAG: HAD-IA family hydrolase [Candidatus Goldbacteria bacterium]|nr:HAD-IA family hydrolase [Candidatus Goldiibacteriota bacterium]
MKVKAVFFDAGETLIHRNPSLATITHRYLLKAGKKVNRAKLNAVLFQAARDMKEIVQKAELNDTEKWHVYMDSVLKKLGIKDNNLKNDVIARLKRGTSFRVYDEVWGVLKGLKKAGIKAGIISNAPRDLKKVFDRLGLTKQFDWIVVSEDAGVEKPDKKIYDLAIKRCGFDRKNVIYIGDNYLADIMGSVAAGIKPVWLLRDTKDAQFTFKTGKAPDGVAVIKSLREVPGVIRQYGGLK